MDSHHAEILQNFVTAYAMLEERVHHALRTHLGDVQRLTLQRDQALQLSAAADLVSKFILSHPFISHIHN